MRILRRIQQKLYRRWKRASLDASSFHNGSLFRIVCSIRCVAARGSRRLSGALDWRVADSRVRMEVGPHRKLGLSELVLAPLHGVEIYFVHESDKISPAVKTCGTRRILRHQNNRHS